MQASEERGKALQRAFAMQHCSCEAIRTEDTAVESQVHGLICIYGSRIRHSSGISILLLLLLWNTTTRVESLKLLTKDDQECSLFGI
jgi:hypothetical protein